MYFTTVCIVHLSRKSTAHPEIFTESIFVLLGHFCIVTYTIILTKVLFHIYPHVVLLIVFVVGTLYVLLTCYICIPSLLCSSLMSFSVASDALTFSEVVSKVTSNRGTLDNLIGPVLDIRRGER